MKEENVQAAMGIILSAGDARLFCKAALDAIAVYDMDLAKEKMKEAHAKITEAHKIQTDAIQEETRGAESEYTLLFAHAQDTLMTVYSEINIAKQMIKIFEAWEVRFQKLENREK